MAAIEESVARPSGIVGGCISALMAPETVAGIDGAGYGDIVFLQRHGPNKIK